MSNWNDDVMRNFDALFKFLNHVYLERGQLYGALIQSMREANQTEITLTMENSKDAGENYYILFTPDREAMTLKVELKEQVKEEVEDEDETPSPIGA